MTKHTIGLAILSASLALASAAQADVRTGRGYVAPIAPMITSASIDNGQRLLTIKGRYFGRDMPSVVLGDITLRVQQSADNQILAELPTGMKKASYNSLSPLDQPGRRTLRAPLRPPNVAPRPARFLTPFL